MYIHFIIKNLVSFRGNNAPKTKLWMLRDSSHMYLRRAVVVAVHFLQSEYNNIIIINNKLLLFAIIFIASNSNLLKCNNNCIYFIIKI